jgi:hypothetical protein
MDSVRAVRIWMILFAVLHGLMAFGAIGVFVRMAPAIETIIARNLQTQEDCESMYKSLLLAQDPSRRESAQDSFARALESARGHVTEPGESEVLDFIAFRQQRAFDGDHRERMVIVSAVSRLSAINHDAMRRADERAQHLGAGGAWGVVFMASLLFVIGLTIARVIRRQVLLPLEELHSVLSMRKAGELQRRCSLAGTSQDVRLVFDEINRLLDVELRVMDAYSRRAGEKS